jgi:gamma-glutamylcyclotransferase (GGCT)/AIG2-like uncharacterized protein YtfP
MKILAYGSLMNSSSLERLLDRKATLKPLTVIGYARIFNVPFFGYAYLNLTKQPGLVLEGAYFEIDDPELEKFAEREAGSDLIEVVPGIFAFIWTESLIEECPVLQTYIDFVSNSATQLGLNIQKGWIKPKIIIDDRQIPKYPDMGQ